MANKIKPISPEELPKQKRLQIPDIILDVVNKLIVKNWNASSREAIVYQKEILNEIGERLDHDKIFDNHWLDIEDIYREQGWIVVYDAPAYCESYDEYFKFKIKK